MCIPSGNSHTESIHKNESGLGKPHISFLYKRKDRRPPYVPYYEGAVPFSKGEQVIRACENVLPVRFFTIRAVYEA
jgi:hypothetical protein